MFYIKEKIKVNKMEIESVDVRNDYEQYRTLGKGNAQGKIDYDKLTPVQIAAYNLSKTLERYPEFSKDARMTIQNELIGLPGLDSMNTEILASVLSYLRSYPQPTAESFKDSVILEYFSRLLPNKKISEEDTKRIHIKLKCIFLKYIVAINSYRENLDAGLNYEDEVNDEVEDEDVDNEEVGEDIDEEEVDNEVDNEDEEMNMY